MAANGPEEQSPTLNGMPNLDPPPPMAMPAAAIEAWLLVRTKFDNSYSF